MFDYTSRYANLETATLTTSDGHTVTYVRRRFLPPLDTLQVVAEVTVSAVAAAPRPAAGPRPPWCAIAAGGNRTPAQA